jgi:pimeloyl-ACP methyl ester carboxylesterase
MTRRRRIALALLATLALAAVALRLLPAPSAPARTRPEKARRTSFPEQDVTVQGLRLRLIDVGPREGGATPLVILPGHTSRIEEYDAIVPRLSKDRRVVVFDFPGSGYAEKPEREYTLAFYEEVVVGVLDALAIPRAHVGGGSQGGHLTIRLGARFPGRFERLVPWSPAGAWEAQPRLAAAAGLVASYGYFVPTVQIQSSYWYRPGFAGKDAALADTFRYYDEVMCPGFMAMYWGMARDQLRHSLFDVAPKVPHETLLIAAEHDTTPGFHEGVRRVAALMPRCELRTYEDAGHAIATEMPLRLAEDVAAFLEKGSETPTAPSADR